MKILYQPTANVCQSEGCVWKTAVLSSAADVSGVLERGGRFGGGPWDLLLPPSHVSIESIKRILSFRFLLIRIYFPVAFYDNIVNVFFGNSTDFKMLKWL